MVTLVYAEQGVVCGRETLLVEFYMCVRVRQWHLFQILRRQLYKCDLLVIYITLTEMRGQQFGDGVLSVANPRFGNSMLSQLSRIL